MNIVIKIRIPFAASLGVLSLATTVDGKKIPDFIKKLNKYLGLPSKSDYILEILKIPVIEKAQKKILSHLNINWQLKIFAQKNWK